MTTNIALIDSSIGRNKLSWQQRSMAHVSLALCNKTGIKTVKFGRYSSTIFSQSFTKELIASHISESVS